MNRLTLVAHLYALRLGKKPLLHCRRAMACAVEAIVGVETLNHLVPTTPPRRLLHWTTAGENRERVSRRCVRPAPILTRVRDSGER